VEYFVIEHRYQDTGYINGDVTYTPPLQEPYRRGHGYLLENCMTEVKLDSGLRNINVDFFSASEAFFVSDAFAKILSRLNVNIELAPSQVNYSNGQATQKKYWLAHFSERKNCFDYYNSDYAGKALIIKSIQTDSSRRVNVIQRLALDENRIQGENFFLINENVSVLNPIASDTLIHFARSEKLKLAVVPISDWKSGLQRKEVPRFY
jgi:hypothetical protein